MNKQLKIVTSVIEQLTA